MHFDDIVIQYLGEFGAYQKIHFILLCLPIMFTAMHVFSWTFTGATIPHRCLVIGENDTDDFPFVPSNYDYQTWAFENKTDGNGDRKCKNSCVRPIGVSVKNWTISDNLTADKLEGCKDGYKWNNNEISLSAVNYWEIVCDKQWIRAFIQSLYYVGQLIGSIVFGIAADKFGRKIVFVLAIVIQITCGSIMAFVPWWPLFAFLLMCVGLSHPGIVLIAIVLGMELVGPRKRVCAGVVAALFFSFGQILLGTLAHQIRVYHKLQLAISLPSLIFLLYWWIIPESPRWLVTRRRFSEADKIMQKVAKMNKRELPSNWYEQLDAHEIKENAKKKYGFFDLFRTPNMRKRIIISGFVGWPATSMAYYGLSMNPNFLGGDRYGTFIIAAALEIPALLFVLLTMNALGRKTLCFCGFIGAAVLLLTTLGVPEDNTRLLMALVVLGKMFVNIVYPTFYVYVPELFPTVIRSTAMGLCSMISCIGAFSASYIALWLVNISKVAVVLIFGGVCLIAGGMVLLLPETSGQPQFDTVEDAEAFGSHQPLFIFSRSKKPLPKSTSSSASGSGSSDDSSVSS